MKLGKQARRAARTTWQSPGHTARKVRNWVIASAVAFILAIVVLIILIGQILETGGQR